MARFEVYRLANTADLRLVVDVQSDWMNNFSTRVVIPLLRRDDLRRTIPTLNPELNVLGTAYVISTPEIAAVPKRLLRETGVSLAAHRDEITAALDFLFGAGQ